MGDGDIAVRVEALESILVEKGYVDPDALDAIVDTYENDVGPRNGPPWSPGLGRPGLPASAARRRHRGDRRAGFGGRQGEHMVAVEKRPGRTHLVVCTLCSCTVAGARPATDTGTSPPAYAAGGGSTRAACSPTSG
jgi:nitrile hydratase